MSVLEPLFSAGSRNKVAEFSTPGWEPSKAQQAMEQILTRADNDVQGVLSANDGMAGGIIAALRQQNLAGKVPVTGLDAALEADQRILNGTQGMSVLYPAREEADKVARIAAAVLKGEEPPEQLFKGSVSNGAGDVPYVPLTPVVITEKNMNILIDQGYVGKADLCRGVSSGVGPC